jgi:hypothetical protein
MYPHLFNIFICIEDVVATIQNERTEQHVLDTYAGKQLPVLNCHRCLINTCVEKSEQHLNKD